MSDVKQCGSLSHHDSHRWPVDDSKWTCVGKDQPTETAVTVIHDAVNHPQHYTSGGIEVIDAIEAWDLGFSLGNAIKYIARAGKKDPAKTLEDLRKSRWYLDRAIATLE